MKFTVTATEGHQGKALEVDLDNETVTVLDAQGQSMGTVPWGSLIEFIQTTATEKTLAEARRHTRAPLAIKVRCRTSDGLEFESLTGGLSGGGLFIENSTPLPPGTDLTVEFALPDRPTERMSAKAKVAWVRNRAERYLLFPGMGIQFTDFDAECRKQVDALVEALNRTRYGD